MNRQALRILILEEQSADVEVLLAALRRAGFEPDAWRAHDRPTFCAGLERNPEIIVADYALPDFGARNALVMVAERGVDIPLIMVARAVGDEEAAECIELGAADFLPKDRPTHLSSAIRRALETKRLREEGARVEATLRDSELRLRTIIETEPECVKIVAGDGKVVEMNPAGLAMLQATSLGQVQQRTLLDFIVPECQAVFANLHQRVMHGEGGTAEFEIVGLQGARRWVETRAAPLRDASGEIRELLAISRDITERKRAEKALRESEERYRRMVDLSPDAVTIHQDGRFVFVNAAAARILGVEEPAELVGRSLLDFMHPDIHEQVKARWVQLYVDKQTVVPADLKMMRPDGSIVYLETRAAPLDWEGRPAAQVVARDTTERKRAEQQLRESEAKYRELIEQADDGIFISDAKGCFVLVNSRGCELLGYTEAELLGLNGKVTYLEGETQVHTQRMVAVAAGKVLRFERMVKRKDGTFFPAEISLKKVGNGLVQVMFHDISTRRSQEQKIARLSRIHAMLSGINSAVVRIRNRQELLKEVCRIAVEHGAFRMAWIGLVDSETGEIKPAAWAGLEEGFLDRVKLSAKAGTVEASGVGGMAVLTGKTRIDNDIGANPAIDPARREETIKRGYRSAIGLPLLVANVTVGAFLLYGQEAGIFNDEEVDLLEGLAGDVSFALEYLANQEAVDHLAYYDSLTGLANRTLLQDRLVQAVHFAERFRWSVTVMVVDLDRFKFVNDSLGHAAGDYLLKVAVGRIVACVRDTDTVARTGGDEFVVVLAGMEQDDNSALQIALRMLEKFAQPVVLEGRELFVTCSIGIASHPSHGKDAETLLKNADAAMYRAKEQGRNNVQFYTPEANARADERLSLESGLRRALERDEFRLHYQPQVDLRTGQICGLEALIRWHRPEVGMVPPDQFIDVLEETGLILPIGDWVLRTACAQNKAWQDQGLTPVRIAVNLSAHQFRQQDLASKVQEALAQTGLESRYLELELTESTLMRSVENTIRIMFELRQIGVRVALDDFGTGYSSLNYLKRLPIDTLKIDRSFVSEITSDPDSAAIAGAIIAMAHSLHLTVMAEGVETEDQLAWLRARGCEQMQGYLFSKPLPADELEQLLRNRTSLPKPLRGPDGPHRIAAR